MQSNPFWNAASRNFAQKARGEVKIILNGTRSHGAVSNQSTFYKYELPQFNSSTINKVKIILLHNLEKPKYETCAKPKTLRLITNELQKRKIDHECEDTPDRIIALFCFEDETSKECQSIKKQLNRSIKLLSNFLINITLILVSSHLNNFLY